MRLLIKLLLLVLLAPLVLVAGEVKLAWSPSPTAGVTNYVLTVARGTNTARVSVGTNLTATLTASAGLYTVAATAQKDGVESEPSNSVLFEMPAAPAQARLLTVEHSISLTGTNKTDVGFFWLRIE